MNSEKKLANPDRYDVLKEHAIRMRKNPTTAESILWNSLRGKKMGYDFIDNTSSEITLPTSFVWKRT